eukprot:CAMPEP_0176458920 /NCGR_PEP_ID=MMETSP0127-20121128/32912_1 /TAXON_ID=938130 /ORGANISM="Platyophrya macrostoma, Strain WH" /LENGTH=40 /DNA_ID= /DNA_START= /DNA_END= /DNA_ORIENTATION=
MMEHVITSSPFRHHLLFMILIETYRTDFILCERFSVVLRV